MNERLWAHPHQTDEEYNAKLNEILGRVMREAFARAELPPAREVIKTSLLIQHMILKDDNEIVHERTGKVLGWFGSAEWSEDRRDIKWVIKANAPVEFVDVKLDWSKLKPEVV